MVLLKNLKFLDSFVLGKIDLEKVLGAVLERKHASHTRLKTINLRGRKIYI